MTDSRPEIVRSEKRACHPGPSTYDTYDKGAASGFDNIVGNEGQLVDLHDPVDLREQPMQEAEIAASEARD